MNPDNATSPAADTGNSAGLPFPTAPLVDTQVPATTPINPASAGSTPAQAADTDTIEPEWVQKTKQIIQATLNDPSEQARQLAALRADYMMKRYNKEIKLGQ
jgi:hypothetical protein